MVVYRKGVRTEAEGCVIVESLEPIPKQAVDKMVASELGVVRA